MNSFILHTDGGSRGNPGPAAIGVVVFDTSYRVIERIGQRVGVVSNNVAEYMGLIKGLEMCAGLQADEVSVYMDSELIVNQMRGLYKVKAAHLRPYFEAAKALSKRFASVSFTAVPREERHQAMADAMVNEAMDNQ